MEGRGKWVTALGQGGRGGGRGRGGRGGRGKRPAAVGADGVAAPARVDPDAGALLLVTLSAHRRAKVYAAPARAIAGATSDTPLLDVREMYEAEGVPYPLPSKKGIALSLADAEALFAASAEVLAAMRGIAAASAEAAAATAAAGASDAAAPAGDGAPAAGGDGDGASGDKAERKRRRREARDSGAA